MSTNFLQPQSTQQSCLSFWLNNLFRILSHALYSWCCAKLLQSCPRLFVTTWTVARQAPLSWDSLGKNTGVGCHFLLQGIFPTQGSNLDLLHCRQTLYCLSHQGSPSANLIFFWTYEMVISEKCLNPVLVSSSRLLVEDNHYTACVPSVKHHPPECSGGQKGRIPAFAWYWEKFCEGKVYSPPIAVTVSLTLYR